MSNAQAQAGESVARVRTALIVDDDEQVLRLLRRWLTGMGLQVVTCRSFEEAKSQLLSKVPDVLLTDIRLQGFNGLELVVRALYESPSVSAIVLTGFDDPVLRRDAEALNARFLVKPISRPELQAAVM